MRVDFRSSSRRLTALPQLGWIGLLLLQPLVAQVTIDFPASGDTWVNRNRADRNFGSRTTMKLRDDRRLAYLKFEVSDIPGVVTSAAIRFRSRDASQPVNVHPVDDADWQESDITWNRRPQPGAALGTTTVTADAWNEFPLSGITAGTHAFMLQQPSSSAGELWSTEGGHAPVLRVVYSVANRPPTAGSDSYTVLHDQLRTVAQPGILANDDDPDGDTIEARIVSGPSHGTLDLHPDGAFSYLPDPGYSGPDSFTYEVVESATAEPLASAPATVALEVLGEGIGQLTDDEVARIEADLGISLDLDRQLELASIVKPSTVEVWRREAEQRIEAHRMAELTLVVTDAEGLPLPGVPVDLRLKRKRFLFGGVMDLKHFTGENPLPITAEAYREGFLPYFDAIGLNNGLKPKLRQWNEAHLPAFFSWCEARGLPARGHLLLWPGGTHLSPGVEALTAELEALETDPSQAQLDELRAAVDAEISDWASRWGGVYEWDVLNETLSNQRLQNLLGRGEMVRWFELAQSAAPGAGRLLNDFQLVSGQNTNRLANFRAELEFLLAAGAPVTAIGFQSRYKWRREHPATILDRLDQLAAPVAGASLPLNATEFEVRQNPGIFEPDEFLRASMTEEILTTYFSHPAVDSVFAWDYLHADTPESLVAGNGQPKLNGLVWHYLNRIRYDTRGRFITDAGGRITLDAFAGEYEATLQHPAGSSTATFSVDGPTTHQISTQLPGVPRLLFPAIADASANADQPDANNGHYRNVQLRAGTRPGYLKFDLTGLTGPAVRMTLHLFPHDSANPANIEADLIEVRLLEDRAAEWSEDGLTWNDRPAVSAGAAIGSGSPDPATGAYSIDLAPEDVGDGVVTLVIEETGNNYGEIASRETLLANSEPMLEVVGGGGDSDSDGIPDAHESALGLDPLDPSDALADPDRDGIASLIEYFTGLSPLNPDQLSTVFTVGRAEAPDRGIVVKVTARRGLLPDQLRLGYLLGGNSWKSTRIEQPDDPALALVGVQTRSTSDELGTLDHHEIHLDPESGFGLFRLEATAPGEP